MIVFPLDSQLTQNVSEVGKFLKLSLSATGEKIIFHHGEPSIPNNPIVPLI
jgi:hypothetical protein